MAGNCKLCGTPYEDGAKFCTECGAVLISRIGEKNNSGDEVNVSAVSEDIKKEEFINENNVETVENSQNTDVTNENSTEAGGVTTPYGAAGSNVTTTPPTTYGGGNYNTPNGNNPYGGVNYNAPNGNSPYGGGNYNAPNGSNPYGGGNYNAPNGSNPYGGGNYNAPNGMNNNSPASRPLNIGMLIFSIVNILVGCCGYTGVLFGIIGIVLVVVAKNASTDIEAMKYNKIAMVVNVIGIITNIVVFAALFVLGFTSALV